MRVPGADKVTHLLEREKARRYLDELSPADLGEDREVS